MNRLHFRVALIPAFLMVFFAGWRVLARCTHGGTIDAASTGCKVSLRLVQR